jgi:hypothetical protein
MNPLLTMSDTFTWANHDAGPCNYLVPPVLLGNVTLPLTVVYTVVYTVRASYRVIYTV